MEKARGSRKAAVNYCTAVSRGQGFQIEIYSERFEIANIQITVQQQERETGFCWRKQKVRDSRGEISGQQYTREMVSVIARQWPEIANSKLLYSSIQGKQVAV